MTLEEKAVDYANKWLWFVKDLEMLEGKPDPKPEYFRIKEAYIAGAKEIEIEKDRYIQELQDEARQRLEEKDKQIEKMRCCWNCSHDYDEEEDLIPKVCKNCIDLCNWEMKE